MESSALGSGNVFDYHSARAWMVLWSLIVTIGALGGIVSIFLKWVFDEISLMYPALFEIKTEDYFTFLFVLAVIYLVIRTAKRKSLNIRFFETYDVAESINQIVLWLWMTSVIAIGYGVFWMLTLLFGWPVPHFLWAVIPSGIIASEAQELLIRALRRFAGNAAPPRQ